MQITKSIIVDLTEDDVREAIVSYLTMKHLKTVFIKFNMRQGLDEDIKFMGCACGCEEIK